MTKVSFWVGAFCGAVLFAAGVLFGMALQEAMQPEPIDAGFMPQPSVSQKCCPGCRCGCASRGFQCGPVGAKTASGEEAFACPHCKKSEN